MVKAHAAVAPQTASKSESLADKLADALNAQQDGDTLEVDPKQLPGAEAKAAYKAVDKKDYFAAEKFTFGNATWFAVVSKNDKDYGYAVKFFSDSGKYAGESVLPD